MTVKEKVRVGAGVLALATMLAIAPNTKKGKVDNVAVHDGIEIRKSEKFVTCTDNFELVGKNNSKVRGLLRVKTKRDNPGGPWYTFSIKFDGKDQRPSLTDAQMDQLSKEIDNTFKACNEKPWGIMRW